MKRCPKATERTVSVLVGVHGLSGGHAMPRNIRFFRSERRSAPHRSRKIGHVQHSRNGCPVLSACGIITYGLWLSLCGEPWDVKQFQVDMLLRHASRTWITESFNSNLSLGCSTAMTGLALKNHPPKWLPSVGVFGARVLAPRCLELIQWPESVESVEELRRDLHPSDY